jgi:hypothetical protein
MICDAGEFPHFRQVLASLRLGHYTRLVLLIRILSRERNARILLDFLP